MPSMMTLADFFSFLKSQGVVKFGGLHPNFSEHIDVEFSPAAVQAAQGQDAVSVMPAPAAASSKRGKDGLTREQQIEAYGAACADTE